MICSIVPRLMESWRDGWMVLKSKQLVLMMTGGVSITHPLVEISMKLSVSASSDLAIQ